MTQWGQWAVFTAGSMIVGAVVASAIVPKATVMKPQPVACLYVGPGVCLSGTTEWAARAAEMPTQSSVTTLVIVADAY